jgi:Nuclease-related domain/PhoH-like protein
MAVMHPSLTSDEIEHDSERLVYLALRDQLSNDYVVLHSYPWLRPDRDGNLREGEADFVILHQSKGMLVLEVKGGELRYHNGVWQRKKSFGFEPITDPFKQARKSMHCLVERIEKQTSGDVQSSDISYGYAVVFPHDNYKGDAPPGADPALIISRRHMDSIAEAIDTAMASWPSRGTRLSEHQWRRLASALLPEFKLFRPISGKAVDIFSRIHELTDEQLDLLRGLYEENDRVYVTGVAGSGKTQLAFDRAVALANSGKRTLFVCYNRHLAEFLRASRDLSASNSDAIEKLKITHFHQFAREVIEDAGVKWPVPDDQETQEAFFIDQVPDLIEQAAFISLDQGREFQWDAIIMDEAQDFHERWWEVLQCTLLKGSDKGIFHAFADPVQRLWDWAPSCPPVEFQTRYTLRRNCRNSRWICRTSTTIGQTEAAYFRRSPLGDRPAINNVPSLSAMKGILLKLVEDLLRNHDLKPNSIVLIGPSGYEKGSLADVSEIGGVPLTNIFSRWHDGKGILVTTAKSFKGLEADVVIMYDLVGFSSVFTRADLYVACTRARSHIHFLVVGKEMLTEIKNAVASAELEIGKVVI